MPGCGFASSEVGSRPWTQAAVALTACVALATILSATSLHPSQQWTATTNPAGLRTLGTVTARPAAVAYAQAQNVRQASLPSGFDASIPAQSHSGKAAGFAAGAIFFLGAAVALARGLLSQTSERVAILSATGEKKEESREMMRQMVNSLDSSDMRLIARGGSMAEVARSKGIDEVAAAIRADQASRKDLTPKDVILDMQRGNGRFWMGLSERPDMTALERRALIMAQAPRICILSCSDSRVPVEIVFDQGLGEVFVVRMAGNILDNNAHGSIEFAVKYLGVKVVMVLGHEACGAVKGAINMSSEDIAKEPADLQVVLNSIKANLNVKELNNISDGRSRDREAIVLNTSNQVKQLQANQLFADKVADGSLLLCGAFYEISSGIVDFFSLDKNGLVVDL